uniref:Oxidored_FMN domain-containing protein n=1 Tax=Parastrongyloides trichosuri TaxID=131310 RepID=A0A0N4ZZY3_PARTI
MVFQRIPSNNAISPSILGKSFTLPTSKRVVRNRFLKAALTEKICLYKPGSIDNGIPNEQLVNLYEKWGNGGFGIILTGNVQVDENNLESAGNVIIEKHLDTPKRREMFKKLAAAGKSDGALMLVQLGHAGRQTPYAINKTPYSSSDIQLGEGPKKWLKFGKPVALTKEEIKTMVIDKMAYAAQYCYECGFDGVEIHGAHGYLLAQFLSNTTNKRTDEYGGSVENKSKIIIEVYNEIRRRIPAETGFVVGIKLNSVEFQNEGLSTDEAVQVAKKIDEVGFDFIELSGGTYEKWNMESPSSSKREGYFEVFSKSIKMSVENAMIILTGGFRTVEGMVSSIEFGATDGIGLGRPITGEPDLPKKILDKKVTSASLNLLEPKGFDVSLMCCSSQMIQMSSKPMKECNSDPCNGIMDASNPVIADKFLQQVMEFAGNLMKNFKEDEPVRGLLYVDDQASLIDTVNENSPIL